MGEAHLARVCELAFAVAKEGEAQSPKIDAPEPMRAYLWLAHLPVRAYSVTERVLDEHDDFRVRVADAATIDNVGEAGFVWLQRRDGWADDYERLTSGQVEEPPPMPEPPATDADAAAEGSTEIPPIPDPPDDGFDVMPDAFEGFDDAPPVPAAPTPDVPDVVSDVAEPEGDAVTTSETSTHATTDPTPPAPAEAAPPEHEPSALAALAESSVIEDELASLRGLVDRLADERKNVRSSVLDLEHEVQRHRADSARMTDELAALGAELATAQSNEQALRSELESAQARISGLESTVEQLTGEVDAAAGAKAALETERDDLATERDATIADRDRLAQQAQEADAKLAVAEQARVDLEGQLGDLSNRWQQQAVEIEQARTIRSQAEDQTRAANEQAQAAVEQARGSVAAISEQLAAVETERDGLRVQLDATRAAVAAAKQAVAAAHQQADAELGSAEGAVEAASGGVDSMTTALSSVAATVAGVELADVEPVAFTAEPVVDPAPPAPFADDDVSVDEPAVEERAVEERAVEERAVEEPTVDDSPTDETALEASPFDDAEPAVDDAVADELAAPADETGADAGDAEVDELVADAEDSSSWDDADEALAAALAAEGVGDIDTAAPPAKRTTIEIPDDIAGDDLAVARLVASTPDVMLLVDGDETARIGWPTLDEGLRREALISYLVELTGENGSAADVVLEGAVEGEEPTSRHVRVRITDGSLDVVELFTAMIDQYALVWPIAVVTDRDDLTEAVTALDCTVLSNTQLLDLFLESETEEG